MQQYIQKVAIAERGCRFGAVDQCIFCGCWVIPAFPRNYPQVCHECADEHVWHYCDRKPKPRSNKDAE